MTRPKSAVRVLPWGVAAVVASAAPAASGAPFVWKGHTWNLTSGSMAGVATGNPANVSIDASGYLHLTIVNSGGAWTASELFTTDRLGFGTYQWQVDGPIDVYDKNFVLVNTFVPEPNLPTTNPAFEPAGPYGIQAIGDNLYVTYFSIAVSGGILDVCKLETSFTNPKCRRLFASNLSGTENAPILASPWGIALAPHNFGPLSDMLLVGNVDDGLINAFDPNTGAVINTLNLNNGSRFSVPGLWGLQFGLGSTANGPTNHLFFSSGPSSKSITDPVFQYAAGLFGVITPPD